MMPALCPLRAAILLVAISVLLACGGGGGGGSSEFLGEGGVTIDADPTGIFIGDRLRIESDLFDVPDGGIVVRYRFPTSLRYVRNSATLEGAGAEVAIAPTYNVSSGTSTYLVFVIDLDDLSEDRSGRLVFALHGATAADNAIIEADPDFRRANRSDEDQFDIDNPEFATGIRIGVDIEASPS